MVLIYTKKKPQKQNRRIFSLCIMYQLRLAFKNKHITWYAKLPFTLMRIFIYENPSKDFGQGELGDCRFGEQDTLEP